MSSVFPAEAGRPGAEVGAFVLLTGLGEGPDDLRAESLAEPQDRVVWDRSAKQANR